MVYLCLQPMAEGQASYAHVTGICDGFRDLGWQVNLRALTPADTGGLLRRVLAGLWLQFRALGLLLRERPDVLYIRWHPLAGLSVLGARARRVPVVLEVNGPPEDFIAAWPRLRPLRRVIERSLWWQLRRSVLAITVTEGLRAWLETLSTTQTEVVPNAADPTTFRPEPEPTSDEAKYVLFFGALAPWQGLEPLLEAAARPEWPSDLQLWIAGSGQLRSTVEAAASARPDRIRYLGAVASERMPQIVRRSQMVAITKHYSRPDLGLSPIKLYEAMASGVPLIVSDLPGLGDVVRAHDCGVVLSEAPSAAEVCAAVLAMSRDQQRRQEFGWRAHCAAREHTWLKRAEATRQAIFYALDQSKKTHD